MNFMYDVYIFKCVTNLLDFSKGNFTEVNSHSSNISRTHFCNYDDTTTTYLKNSTMILMGNKSVRLEMAALYMVGERDAYILQH